jgi:spermidine/putrescine transport system permease protein
MRDRPEVTQAGSVVIERPAVGAPAAEASRVATGRRRPTSRGFDRPRFLPVITALVFVYLFAPILVVTWFSFNSKQSLNVFGSPSLKWYEQLVQDPIITGSLFASIEIALITMVVSTVIGTLLAFGLCEPAPGSAGRPTSSCSSTWSARRS